MNTADLLLEIKKGSTAAQKLLFNMLADKMLALCCRYVKSRQDAEEIMLDGFLKFFNKIGSFHYQNDAALFGFIKKIMINECLMFLRKRNVFTIVSETEIEEVPFPESALDNLSAAEIYALIVQLPVGYRTVFNLSVIEGMEHKEIAALLGISTGTSKSQLSKAKLLLQKLITQKGIVYARQGSK
jgi:RNA polymerase sigma-70 factor (ECF subfamily)